MQDIRQFILFLRSYIADRVFGFGKTFESIKDIIVAFLIVKRGKYSTSFLNTSFVLLAGAAVIGGPVIAENNPFALPLSDSQAGNQVSEVAFNPYESSIATQFSIKPRDKIEQYTIKSGDTLASISQKFDISIDTIKWANKDLLNGGDKIKTGDVLKILPITGVAHKVNSGDNIYAIAKKYKTDAQKIVNFPFNEFADLDSFSLTPGQIIYVPDGVIEDQQAPALAPSRFYAQVQAGVKGNSNFIWPTNGMVTQYPIWYHMAIDIANASAPPVIAADTGTVTFAGCINWGYGCHIIIDHGNGYRTLYGHLSVIDVSPGQTVSQGQKIGNMGSTGRSTGTHLHFEIRSGETLLNPLGFLK